MIPVISIVGSSGSGKTTLIERLIPKLKEKGYKVGIIKHDAHHFDIDHKGKDTYRMAEAGADNVVISSKDKMAMVKELQEEQDIDNIINWLFKDMDVVITEGYKSKDKPKIEVVRSHRPITSKSNNLIAVVDNTCRKELFSVPESWENISLFDIYDLDEITEFIEKRFLKAYCLSTTRGQH